MTRRLFVLFATVCALGCGGDFGVGFGQEEDINSSKLRIGWDEFKKLYDEKNVVVVDVRDVGSFEAGRIPGSRSVPLDEVDKRAAELKKLKKPVVTYCA
jgi:3-mercaptopyruvate sulfurtransferase SseA